MIILLNKSEDIINAINYEFVNNDIERKIIKIQVDQQTLELLVDCYLKNEK